MLKLLTKIRFLPLTIFAATMLLTVKIGDIWEGFDGLDEGSIQVAGAVAQTETDANRPRRPARTLRRMQREAPRPKKPCRRL